MAGFSSQDETALEQIIRAFEFTQIELTVYRDRGYAQKRGAGQPEADRCALARAFLAKAVLDLKTTRALIDRLQADSKLRRLCGFDLRFALPSESTFSRAFEELASGELIQRVHARMIEDTLGHQLIGHISRDSTAIEARETIAKKEQTEVAPAKPKYKRGRPSKGEVRPAPEPSALERQRTQTLAQMMAEIDTAWRHRYQEECARLQDQLERLQAAPGYGVLRCAHQRRSYWSECA